MTNGTEDHPLTAAARSRAAATRGSSTKNATRVNVRDPAPTSIATGGSNRSSRLLSPMTAHRQRVAVRQAAPATAHCAVAHRDRPLHGICSPAGEPPLPEGMSVNGERMDVRYIVGVLMGNRDLVRRLTAEAGTVPAGT